MIIFPAIDIYEGKVVRLLKGDYNKMTVYSENVVDKACEIEAAGGEWLHLVDLEGAKEGSAPNFNYVEEICKKTGLKVEIGGGIRTEATIKKYINAGADRIILGTKAATDKDFLKKMTDKYRERIAVGIDVKEEKVAMDGINVSFYEKLSKFTDMDITASGGVTTLDDLIKLKNTGIYGAILGKAMYTGNIDLREALEI